MIDKIEKISGKAIPIIGNDIDTDRIIPARFMKCLTFEGLGQFAFYDERFEEDGTEKEHPLNSARFREHSIIVTNRNFGCGSSREHAPWALFGIGVKCIIAQSYAEIFANNCSSLGIPAVIAPEDTCRKLQELIETEPDSDFKINLKEKTISTGKYSFDFDMPETYRLALLEGKWDTTSMLLENMEEIKRKNHELPSFP